MSLSQNFGPNVSTKQMNVVVSTRELRISISNDPPLVEGTFPGVVSDSFWSVDDGNLELTVFKEVSANWPALLLQHIPVSDDIADDASVEHNGAGVSRSEAEYASLEHNGASVTRSEAHLEFDTGLESDVQDTAFGAKIQAPMDTIDLAESYSGMPLAGKFAREKTESLERALSINERRSTISTLIISVV